MSLHSLGMPLGTNELRDWLTAHVAGPALGELIAELSAVHPTQSKAELADVLLESLPELLAQGPSLLSEESVRKLISHPNTLWELQELVLRDGSNAWFEHRSTSIDQAVRRQTDRLGPRLSEASGDPKSNRQWSKRPWAILAAATAGIVLGRLSLQFLAEESIDHERELAVRTTNPASQHTAPTSNTVVPKAFPAPAPLSSTDEAMQKALLGVAAAASSVVRQDSPPQAVAVQPFQAPAAAGSVDVRMPISVPRSAASIKSSVVEDRPPQTGAVKPMPALAAAPPPPTPLANSPTDSTGPPVSAALPAAAPPPAPSAASSVDVSPRRNALMPNDETPSTSHAARSTPAFAWNREDSFALGYKRKEFLIRLAGHADDWFQRRPGTLEELTLRLIDFRRGCTRLLFHRATLPEQDRDWLIDNCRIWTRSIDEHVAAAEADSATFERVKPKADLTIRELIEMLHIRSKP